MLFKVETPREKEAKGEFINSESGASSSLFGSRRKSVFYQVILRQCG